MVKLRLREGLCEFFKTTGYHRYSEVPSFQFMPLNTTSPLWGEWGRPGANLICARSIFRGAELRCLPPIKRVWRDHGYVPWCSDECSLSPITQGSHHLWNTQAERLARMSFGSPRLTALVLCNWGGVWPHRLGFYHSPPFPSWEFFVLWRFPVCIFSVWFSTVAQDSWPCSTDSPEAQTPLIQPRAAAWKALGVESPGLVPQLALRVPADFSQQGLPIASLSDYSFVGSLS